ncbi:MAG: hypothetical protein KatS3mg111_2315 [Pirellulaceae bacterium]|nr:MAG: hypothetical protein KatS3mg111_2315 [Pirellulaceae bacterium]
MLDRTSIQASTSLWDHFDMQLLSRDDRTKVNYGTFNILPPCRQWGFVVWPPLLPP